MAERYDVLLVGIIRGASSEETLEKLARLFKQPVEVLREKLVNKPSVLQRGVGLEQANKLADAVMARGGLCELQKQSSPSPKVSGVGKTDATDKVCPKCEYRRGEKDAFVPAYECPKCGVIYAKYEQELVKAKQVELEKLEQPGHSLLAEAAQEGDEEIERIYRILQGLLEEQAASSGLNDKKSTVESIALLVVFIIAGIIFYYSRWYWSLLSFVVGGIVTVFLGQMLFSGTARLVVHHFIEKIPAQLKRDPQRFRAIFEFIAEHADVSLRQDLQNHLARLPQATASEALKVQVGRVLKPYIIEQADEDDSDIESQLKRSSKEEEAFAQRYPEASELLYMELIKFHPSFFEEASASYRIAISSEMVFLVENGVVSKIPLSFVRKITVGDERHNFSVEAMVAGVLNPLFGKEGVRIRLDLHLFIPIKGRGGASDYSGLSFRTDGETWRRVEPFWRAAMAEVSELKPRCPACDAHEILPVTATFAEHLGVSSPQTKAECGHCKTKFLFDFLTGQLIRKA